EASRREARQAVDAMYLRATGRLFANDPEGMATQNEFLQKALGFYERFAAEQGTDPLVRFEQAKAHVRAGDIRLKLGRIVGPDGAGDAYTRADDLLQALVTEYPNSFEYAEALTGLENSRGILGIRAGRPEEAVDWFQRAVTRRRGLIGRAPDPPA